MNNYWIQERNKKIEEIQSSIKAFSIGFHYRNEDLNISDNEFINGNIVNFTSNDCNNDLDSFYCSLDCMKFDDLDLNENVNWSYIVTS
jgi:hypothetical protein